LLFLSRPSLLALLKGFHNLLLGLKVYLRHREAAPTGGPSL
jgi:hypothetical protein